MTRHSRLGNNVNMNLLKACAVILSLAVIIFIIRNMDLLKDQTFDVIQTTGFHVFLQTQFKENFSITTPHDFCTYKPLSSADAEEERLLLDSIAWPDTPLPVPLPLTQTSDPAHSSFTILPPMGAEWHVGDQLKVIIQMHDFQGNAKKFGGDFLIARLHNRTLGAGVAGKIVDHLNGSYSVVFTLLWEGKAQVEVMLIHPSEAVTVLHRLSREQPDRVFFKSLFRSGSISETTVCNVCLRQTNQPLCDLTDPRTGEPWFCYKPKTLSCDSRIQHMKGGYIKKLNPQEDKLFNSKVNMKVYIQAAGPTTVTVLPQKQDFYPSNSSEQSGVKTGSKKSGLSGYYYNGVWRPLDGTKVHQFNNPSTISQCLKGKTVHLYGDSTIRQWFEYLDASLPGARELILDSPKKTGPYMIWDNTKGTLVTYRCHGPPLSYTYVPTSQLRYIANELDGLVGGPNTVVVVGIWAHFAPFPIELYIRRLQSIRRALVRLLNRAPGTLVVIRTANLREMTSNSALNFSDWFSFQRGKVLKAALKGLNVRIVDAWEMTLAHHLPHIIHPQPPIIKNMIDILLSHVCPQ